MSITDCIEQAGYDSTQIEDPKAFITEQRRIVERRKELAAKQQQMHTNLLSKVTSHPKGEVVGLRSVLANDITGLAKWSNVEGRTNAIVGQAHAGLVNTYQLLSTRKFGLTRNKNLANDFIREVFGTNTSSGKAQALAREWSATSDMLRTRFNQAGGDIGKLETWGLPQSHSQHKVARATKEDWKAFISPKLRNADEMDLDYIYETISTGGVNKRTPEPSPGGMMVANRRREPRVLHFKDGNAWLAYNEKFGNTSDPMSILSDHVRSMSQDIANMEILGPNPEHMFKTLHNQVKQVDDSGFSYYTDSLYEVVSGKIDESAATTTAERNMEAWFSTARAVQTASKLGAATLSAVSDVGTLFVNTKLHGMSATKMLKSIFSHLDTREQMNTAELGFALDIFNSSITRRFDEVGKGVSSQVAEGVLRASGLNMWTESLRKAFQYEFYNHLKTKPANLFERYGWSKAQVEALDFDNLRLGEQTRLLEMVNREGEYAVLMPTARSRVITTGGKQKGSVSGELTRTAMQFKSFPATFLIQQVGRVFYDQSIPLQTRMQYAAAIVTSTTLLGAVSMSLKDASKGYTDQRDGSPFKEGKQSLTDQGAFWSAALVQGGGAGILGDFLFSDQNRFGGGLAATLAGPTVGTLDRAVKTSIGNVQQALQGKDSHFLAESIDLINREVNPLNLWYSKAALDMLITENLKLELDPKYRAKRRRMLRKRRKEYGQTRAY